MMPKKRIGSASNHDPVPSERRFKVTLNELSSGRLDFMRIQCGELVLDPAPTVMQVLKFGSAQWQSPSRCADFELKESLAELFEYIRGTDDGAIRCLEVRHGLPFSMEIEQRISRGMPDVKGEHVEAV